MYVIVGVVGLILLSLFLTAKSRQPGESFQGAELRELQEGTEAVNRGMINPLVWLLIIGVFALLKISNGWSVGLALPAMYLMSGGAKHTIQAATPKTVDIVAPKHGCLRIFSAGGFILLMGFVGLLLYAVYLYNTGNYAP